MTVVQEWNGSGAGILSVRREIAAEHHEIHGLAAFRGIAEQIAGKSGERELQFDRKAVRQTDGFCAGFRNMADLQIVMAFPGLSRTGVIKYAIRGDHGFQIVDQTGVRIQKKFHGIAAVRGGTRTGYDGGIKDPDCEIEEFPVVLQFPFRRLSAGLITERGITMRIGSVVTDLELSPTPRSYGDDPFAWCTRCGACAKRCLAHAIGKTNAERDKPRCGAYIVNHVNPGREERYGWLDLALGCGLCQTAVPCEFRCPK